MSRWALLIASIISSSLSSYSQTWCGKNYLKGHPIIPPDGAFHVPSVSSQPRVSLRCVPRIQPYLEDGTVQQPTMLVGAYSHSEESPDAHPIDPLMIPDLDNTQIYVELWAHNHRLAKRHLSLGEVNVEVPFSFGHLTPQGSPYLVECIARLKSLNHEQVIRTNASLFYLPTPNIGSVTKVDRLTGALLARPIAQKDRPYEEIFPLGFYTSFGNYLDSNLTILDEVKAQGFNLVHPVPPFEDITALNRILDRMEELGLYLVYDMRHSYQNHDALLQEVATIKDRSNLLLWYTADEPDGPNNPINTLQSAYEAIYSLDGYHPVSIALNCADYRFAQYVEWSDIVTADTYMIGNDVKHSLKYDTPCTPQFGCCGCDNCLGDFSDISSRLDSYGARLRILGWDQTKVVWSVTQAFGGEEFWTRAPTGREWLVQALLSINHGARGIMPWLDPTPPEIKAAASSFARIIGPVKQFLFNPKATVLPLAHDATQSRVDAKTWTVGRETLLLAVNLDNKPNTFPRKWTGIKTTQWLLKEDVQGTHYPNGDVQLTFGSLGAVAVILVENARMYDEL
ncbi:hypothetical protein BDN72DRAFT_786858 [Pluteus cervinus]|uniref:Uncharacterized protein n=1 Tax=Pluteus cervinus TaxID=181527 RepID=A0ACD3BDF1_9AGAR|nr:hypothetical protein BDN72DRAFT_786858 [Pluteus cervinus]